MKIKQKETRKEMPMTKDIRKSQMVKIKVVPNLDKSLLSDVERLLFDLSESRVPSEEDIRLVSNSFDESIERDSSRHEDLAVAMVSVGRDSSSVWRNCERFIGKVAWNATWNIIKRSIDNCITSKRNDRELFTYLVEIDRDVEWNNRQFDAVCEKSYEAWSSIVRMRGQQFGQQFAYIGLLFQIDTSIAILAQLSHHSISGNSRIFDLVDIANQLRFCTTTTNLENCPSFPMDVCVDQIVAFIPNEADMVVEVSRINLLSSSYAAIMDYTKEEWSMTSTMDVLFIEDFGIGEGVAREWISSVAHRMFYDSRFFKTCPEEPSVVHPNVDYKQPDDPKWFEFAGCIIGMAAKMDIPIGVHLSRAAWKMMTMRPLSLVDLLQVDPALHRSMTRVLNSDPEEFDAMGLENFVTHGEVEVALFPRSDLVKVTHGNRDRYVQLQAQHFLRRSTIPCIEMMKGILRVLHNDRSEHLLAAMMRADPLELNLFFGGQGYGRCLSPTECSSRTVLTTLPRDKETMGEIVRSVFFAMLCEMDNEFRLRILRFWTGLRCLPLSGFNSLSLNIVVNTTLSRERLPTSQTCSYTLIMPAYGDLREMRDKFTTAVLDTTIDND